MPRLGANISLRAMVWIWAKSAFLSLNHSNASEPVVASYGLDRLSMLELKMNSNLEVLEAEVLKLTPADRSHLLERLIASLDSDPEVEAAWEREADRRETLLESGSVVEVPGSEAMNRLRSRLVR
jgi:hypothetical protein